MSTAKLNTQHDYVTLRVKFDDKSTLNLTRSRNGVKLSGSRATKEAFDFFDAYLRRQNGQTIGETMETLRSKAAASSDITSFLNSILVCA